MRQTAWPDWPPFSGNGIVLEIGSGRRIRAMSSTPFDNPSKGKGGVERVRKYYAIARKRGYVRSEAERVIVKNLASVYAATRTPEPAKELAQLPS